MFGLQMLDVVIGMAFVYLLLSLICSAAGEMIEAWLKYRARDLEQGIRQLLKDEKGEWAQKIYDHPLVNGLFKGKYEPGKIKKEWWYPGGSDLPSYIPARNFALALMDIVSAPTSAGLPAQSASAGAAGSTPAPALPAGGAPTSSLNALRDAIDNMPVSSSLKQALRPLVNAAGDNIDKARENIEAWYNSTMERVAGWYKRHTQWILLALGFGVTIAANVNTLAIVDSLSRDGALRAAIVAQAQEAVKQSGPPAGNWDETIQAAQQLGVPMGWSDVQFEWPGFSFADWWSLVFSHIVGWTITAFAITMGAPFWFDLLNRLNVVRSTIKPGEPGEDRNSKKQGQP